MRTLALTSVLVLAAACNSQSGNYNDRSIDLPAIDWSNARMTPYEGSEGAYGDMDLTRASMQGQLPHAGSFDDVGGYGSMSLDTWEGMSWIYLDMNTLSTDGWGMVGVNLTVEDDGSATWGTGSTVGCSGPSEGEAFFDEQPDDAELTAEVVTIDGQDFVEITFEGDFRGDNDVVGVALVPAATDGE
ncbi:MAG: hypothetical protein H6736_10810 [Alphaproteobacteria bacterium]|nr:hypothetical protein [Alphaproteobacteria bacterium]MCB9692293.1 hypothetical protein [Alphaproteobacteria bacterium]